MTDWFGEMLSPDAAPVPAAEEFSPTPVHGPEIGITSAALHHEISRNTLDRAHEEHKATAEAIGEILNAGAQPVAPSALVEPQLSPRGTASRVPRGKARAPFASIPRTFLSKTHVSVPRLVDGRVKTDEIAASEALSDVRDEIKAIGTLADRAQHHGLKSALATLPALRDFDTDPIAEAAAHYEQDGLAQADAEQRAITDHLQDLAAERNRIEAAVVSAFENFDPARYAQLAGTETEEVTA